MNKLIIIVLACVVAISGKSVFKLVPTLGVVDPVWRCGGMGTHVELRISDCNGNCTFIPGIRYDSEEDFIPFAAAASLSLRLQICPDFCFTIIDVELSGSPVLPGNLYTARYSIVPNDYLSGLGSVQFIVKIYNTSTGFEEICVYTYIDVL